jgi:L-fucono-1,5-lactonase
MRIDAHQHFWRYQPARDVWIGDNMPVLKRDYLPADLVPELGANGIEATIAVQADQSESETLFLLEQAGHNPFIAGVVGWVDLCAADARERLQYFSGFQKLRGFRHVAQSEPDDRFLVREDFVRGVAMLGEFGLTYDILIYARQLPAAVELVEKLPEQAFVLDHIAKPNMAKLKPGGESPEFDNWASGIRSLARNPRVYCKLSGLITEASWSGWRADDFKPYLDIVFEAFGADRVMFGSDWPVCLLAGTYAQVKGLIEDYACGFAHSAREKIFGNNAARFYGLEASWNRALIDMSDGRSHGSGSSK